MKKENIALFKRFLVSRGLDLIYVGLYNSDRKNEDDVEVFLLNVDANDVLAKAFFIKEGYDTASPFRQRRYWLDKQQEFNQEMISAAKEGWYSTHNANRIEKWASTELGISTSKKKKKKVAQVVPQKKVEVAPTPQVPKVETPKAKKEESTSAKAVASVSQFKFFDLSSKPSSCGLRENEISVNCKNGSHKVSFNATHSNEILESGLKYMAVGQDEFTGQVRFVFNTEKGLAYPPSCVKDGKVVINSVALVNLMQKLFGRTDEYFTLRISANIANSTKYLTYNINEK